MMACSINYAVSGSKNHDLSSQPQHKYKNMMMDSKIGDGLQEMRHKMMFCDVSLVADNVDIPAHRNILASSSKYFSRLLTGSFVEKDKFSISINDVKPEILTSLVDYIYSSEIIITKDNVEQLFITSKML